MTTANSRVISIFVLAGLLDCGSLAPPFALAGDHPFVEYDDGLVTLAADGVPKADLIAIIAAQADLRLVQHATLDGTITASFEAEPLGAVLGAILEGGSYQLLQRAWTDSAAAADSEQSGTLWVFSSGDSPAPRATVSLEAALLEGSYEEKKTAIRSLRKMGDAASVQTLSIGLHDPDDRIRDAALEALSRIGSEESLAAIASLVIDSNPWTRIEAANALSLTASRSALEYLQLALNDPDPRVRMAAIDAFADIPGPDSVTAIHRAGRDPDPEVRAYAAETLEDAEATIAFHARRRALGRGGPDGANFDAAD